MSFTRYGFADAVSGFFELPTAQAARLIPREHRPIELHHGSAVLAVTCFDFTDSEVGAYGELVMAVLVSPWVEPSAALPKSAFFPYCVATTTPEARAHAIARWHLPHYMADVTLAFGRSPESLAVQVSAAGQPVLNMRVHAHRFEPVSHRYQSFMRDASGGYLANIRMEGAQSEHEEERGELALFPHPLHAGLDVDEVANVPFRELWMRPGLQTFDPLRPHPAP
jgi:hypothetical protein